MIHHVLVPVRWVSLEVEGRKREVKEEVMEDKGKF